MPGSRKRRRGAINPGEYVAVNIDGAAHCVGLYVTNAGQAIWYDSDGNFGYECASSTIDIDEGAWEVFRETMSINMDLGDTPNLFAQMDGRGGRITTINKIPPKAHGVKNTSHSRKRKAVVKKSKDAADSDIDRDCYQGGPPSSESETATIAECQPAEREGGGLLDLHR